MKISTREYIEALAKKQEDRERIRNAAPDLLAALSRMLNELPTRRDWLDPVTERIARAACAKANGK